MARKRKPGPRTKSGRLSRAYKAEARDHGTAEVQAKRIALVGEADPALAASALGVLLARGLLDVKDRPEMARDRYHAGLRYRELRSAIFPPIWPNSPVGPAINEDRRAKIEREFRSIVGNWQPETQWSKERPAPHELFIPGLLTRDQIRIVERVAIYEWIPTWAFLAQGKWLNVDVAEHDVLLSGLDALSTRTRRKQNLVDILPIQIVGDKTGQLELCL